MKSCSTGYSMKWMDCADVFFILPTNRPETLEPAIAGLPGRIDQPPAMLALFPHMQKRLTTERCKPLMYNEFLVGSAGFELAAPAV